MEKIHGNLAKIDEVFVIIVHFLEVAWYNVSKHCAHID